MKSAAFLSYVRDLNIQDDGIIHIIKESLEREMRINGIDFKIFIDTADIPIGGRWREFIENAPSAIPFFIPIIVEAYFDSDPCKNEYRSFLARERKLQRNDLILPIYYANCVQADKENDLEKSEIKFDIFERNYFDWRSTRHSKPDSRKFNAQITELSNRITFVVRRESKSLENENDYITPDETITIDDQNAPQINLEQLHLASRLKLNTEELVIVERIMSESKTQKNIIKELYTRINDTDQIISDKLHRRCLTKGLIDENCSQTEFVFRVRDLYHKNLLSINATGHQTTSVAPIAIVRQALRIAGVYTS